MTDQQFPSVPYGCTVRGEDEIAAAVDVLRSCTQMGPKTRLFEEIGYPLEPSEISAAFALVQLDKLAHNIEARIANFSEQLAFSPAVSTMIVPECPEG